MASTGLDAVQYKQKCFEDGMDYARGGGSYITHVYVPSLKLTFNEKGFVFKGEEIRMPEYPTEKYSSDDKINEISRQVYAKKLKEYNEFLANMHKITITHETAELLKQIIEHEEVFKSAKSKLMTSFKF